MKKHLKTCILSLLVLLSACNYDEKPISKIEDPELVAIAFFHAIYNEKDINKAASVCAPQLARILNHYKSPSSVGRHLFNMSFDNVVISPDTSGVKVRERFKDRAIVTVFLDGNYRDNKVKDIKRLSLVQQGDTWIIDKILKDPF